MWEALGIWTFIVLTLSVSDAGNSPIDIREMFAIWLAPILIAAFLMFIAWLSDRFPERKNGFND